MKKYLFSCLLMFLLSLSFASTTWAQKPLKGSWIVTVQTPVGTLPVPINFKNKGKGDITGPAGKIPFAYREKGTSYSLVFEGVGLGPGGTDLSILVRGSKQDTTVDGKAIFISDVVDPSNPIGFGIFIGNVAGMRNK